MITSMYCIADIATSNCPPTVGMNETDAVEYCTMISDMYIYCLYLLMR